VRSAIDYDKSRYEIFNLGESRTVELNYLIELLEDSLGKRANVEYLPMQPGDVPQTLADITKAGRYLNYQPETQIEVGIKKFVQWIKNGNYYPVAFNRESQALDSSSV
jgi:UDP-glucuronate 4-epimerase